MTITLTGVTDAEAAGVVAVIEPSALTTIFLARQADVVQERYTAGALPAALNPYPAIFITVPPVTGPILGVTEVMAGTKV